MENNIKNRLIILIPVIIITALISGGLFFKMGYNHALSQINGDVKAKQAFKVTDKEFQQEKRINGITSGYEHKFSVSKRGSSSDSIVIFFYEVPTIKGNTVTMDFTILNNVVREKYPIYFNSDEISLYFNDQKIAVSGENSKRGFSEIEYGKQERFIVEFKVQDIYEIWKYDRSEDKIQFALPRVYYGKYFNVNDNHQTEVIKFPRFFRN